MEHLAPIPKTSAPALPLSPGCASLEAVALGTWSAAMCGVVGLLGAQCLQSFC